jgi:hypothetical protein
MISRLLLMLCRLEIDRYGRHRLTGIDPATARHLEELEREMER